MIRRLAILASVIFLTLSTAASAQQSNKSKSKDRYREKDPPAKSELVREVEIQNALNRLAADQFRAAISDLTVLFQQNMTSPPAAARYYAYATLAAYETAARYQPKGFPSLRTTLRNMPPVNSFTPADSVFFPLAAVYALLETAKTMVPSGQMLLQKQLELEARFRQMGVPEVQILGSEVAGRAISSAIVQYSRSDGYQYMASLPRRQSGDPNGWQPTPPERRDAIEPNWNTMRPFLLESPLPFRAQPPAAFDNNADGAYIGLLRDLYETTRNLSPEQRNMAAAWNDNPYDNQISAGAHWMNICQAACAQQQRSFRETVLASTALALTLSDAYVLCWDEKMRSNRARPITVINRLLDPNWQPLMRTPPSPEYTSDNAMVASAAAEILSRYLGETATFTDQMPNRPVMIYPSFRQAANIAGAAQLFGGIQFRDAVENGSSSGEALGKWVLNKLPTGL